MTTVTPALPGELWHAILLQSGNQPRTAMILMCLNRDTTVVLTPVLVRWLRRLFSDVNDVCRWNDTRTMWQYWQQYRAMTMSPGALLTMIQDCITGDPPRPVLVSLLGLLARIATPATLIHPACRECNHWQCLEWRIGEMRLQIAIESEVTVTEVMNK